MPNKKYTVKNTCKVLQKWRNYPKSGHTGSIHKDLILQTDKNSFAKFWQNEEPLFAAN